MQNDTLYNRIIEKVTAEIVEGGGGVFMTEMTIEMDGSSATITMDKSYNEFKEAFISGKTIRMQYMDENINNYAYCDIYVIEMYDNGEDSFRIYLITAIYYNLGIELDFEGNDFDAPLTLTITTS